MDVQKTKLPGVKIIKPSVFGDERGFFKETFSSKRYEQEAHIQFQFVQDNYSRSQRNVLRGLHFQKTKPQGKLVSVARGTVFDVVVDINPKSISFGQYVSVELSESNHLQLWVPPGMAHGFCVLSDFADFVYKCTDYYWPEDEAGLAWNCPEVQIDWPIKTPILSEKDKNHPHLSEIWS